MRASATRSPPVAVGRSVGGGPSADDRRTVVRGLPGQAMQRQLPELLKAFLGSDRIGNRFESFAGKAAAAAAVAVLRPEAEATSAIFFFWDSVAISFSAGEAPPPLRVTLGSLARRLPKWNRFTTRLKEVLTQGCSGRRLCVQPPRRRRCHASGWAGADGRHVRPQVSRTAPRTPRAT